MVAWWWLLIVAWISFGLGVIFWSLCARPRSQANGLSHDSAPAPAGDAGPPSFQPPRKVALDQALKFEDIAPVPLDQPPA